MRDGQNADLILETLRIRKKLALNVFLGVMLIAAAGAFFTLRYSASTLLALDPRSVSNNQQGNSQNVVDLAWMDLSNKKLQSIINQFQLNSGLTRIRAQNQVFNYVRSNISIHQVDTSGSNVPSSVQLTYTGFGPSTVVNVTNAIAQALSQPHPAAQQAGPVNAGNLAAEIAKVRTTLQLLSQARKAPTSQDQLQKFFRTDADLQAQRKVTVVELAALDQQAAQDSAIQARARTSAQAQAAVPPPPSPAAMALEAQLKQAQTRLEALLQRYTNAYPEVQEQRETIANLQQQLSRIPQPKPRPRVPVQSAPTPEQIRLTNERALILERQQGLDEAIKNNQEHAEAVRQKLGNSKSFDQDYAFEQQRYQALLKQQGTGATDLPRFVMIQNASTATASGVATEPLFWIASLGAALLVACFAAFVVEHFDPGAEGDPTPRSLHTH